MATGGHNKRSTTKVRGLTLVEMTLILSVIAILSTVLIPTIMAQITQARILRARDDVHQLGNAIERFYTDTGFLPQSTDSIDGGPGTSYIDLLITDGSIPALPASSASDVMDWTNGKTDFFANHLVNNVPGYALKTESDIPGWNGPYLANFPEPDPWGNRYMCNILFLDPRPGVVKENGTPKNAVFVLSAGPDGIIETTYEQLVTNVAYGGDDIVHRVQ